MTDELSELYRFLAARGRAIREAEERQAAEGEQFGDQTPSAAGAASSTADGAQVDFMPDPGDGKRGEV